MIKILVLLSLSLPFTAAGQVTIQKGATFYISANELMSIEGDLSTEEDIEGEGILILEGNTLQTVNFSNHKLSRLVVQNASNVQLASALGVVRGLRLITGRLQLGSNDLYLSEQCVVQGGSSSYIEAGDKGKVVKLISRDVSNLLIPIGSAYTYSPLVLTSTGSYHNAFIEIRTRSTASPEKPQSIPNYLESYWILNRKGVDGHLIITAFYGKLTGAENKIRPYYWNGNTWLTKANVTKPRKGILSWEVPEGSGQLYGMSEDKSMGTEANKMTVFPNPVTSVATLAIWSMFDENAIIKIVDSRGIPVLMQRIVLVKGPNKVGIDVANLASGHYTMSSTQVNIKSIQLIKL